VRRRQFICGITSLTLLSGCGVLPTLSRPTTARVSRIGYIGNTSNPVGAQYLSGLKQGLAELGNVEGQSVTYEVHNAANSSNAQLLEFAQELVRLPVDVIVGTGSNNSIPATQATSVLPIVFIGATDPVGQGLVESLAHPGGNVTGVTNVPASVVGKRLELLARLMRGLTRVGMFTAFGPADVAASTLKLQAATPVADSLGIQLKTLSVRAPEDVEPALAEGLAWSAQALLVVSGSVVNDVSVSQRLVDFQTQNNVPVIFAETPDGTTEGGLMSYTASNAGLARVAASLVDRILKGASPADLPVQQPTEYEFVVNRTVANEVGITIPSEVAADVSQWDQ
jgi:putative ABC transport system substrate-binding protein